MIIFINGTISSGKTTVAKIIEKRLPNTAVIEIDNLRDFIRWMPLDDSIPLNLKNTVSVIKNFVNKNLNVIVPYPISQNNYDYLIKNLKNLNTKNYTFTLNPNPKELIKGKRGRDLDNWEKHRIEYHTKIGLNKPNFGKIIDNTNQTPEETADIILKAVGEK